MSPYLKKNPSQKWACGVALGIGFDHTHKKKSPRSALYLYESTVFAIFKNKTFLFHMKLFQASAD
jgi:hypothetical protein